MAVSPRGLNLPAELPTAPPASSSAARYVSTSSRRRVLVSGLTAWQVCGSMLGNPIVSIKLPPLWNVSSQSTR